MIMKIDDFIKNYHELLWPERSTNVIGGNNNISWLFVEKGDIVGVGHQKDDWQKINTSHKGEVLVPSKREYISLVHYSCLDDFYVTRIFGGKISKKYLDDLEKEVQEYEPGRLIGPRSQIFDLLRKVGVYKQDSPIVEQLPLPQN